MTLPTDGVIVGVDLGGTSIRAAIATSGTTHGDPVHANTPALAGPAAVLDAVAEVTKAAAADRKLLGMSIGIPGPLDPTRGVVFAAPHLTGWSNVPARDELQKRLGCPVEIHNDASLAGYAESVAGAGKGATPMLFVTVSTGIGGAIIVGGDVMVGHAGTGGELGHMVIERGGPPCAQGHPGCLEAVASGTAIANQARAAVANGEKTLLSKTDQATLSAMDVQAAAEKGDAVAQRIYEHAGEAVGEALGGLINLLSPQVVVVGGGLIHAGPLLFDPLLRAVRKIAFEVPYRRCTISRAGLGTDAGLVGAVAWGVRAFG